MRIVLSALLLCPLAMAAEHRGTVKSAGLPIPGAIVTATQGEQLVTTSTDESGAYRFANLGAGTWQVSVEMMGFASLSQALQVGETAPSLDFALKLGKSEPPKPVAPSSPAPT